MALTAQPPRVELQLRYALLKTLKILDNFLNLFVQDVERSAHSRYALPARISDF
jgi:hypothetical protein